ncbi:MAG: dUTP diphosphatase [Candidatus Komeilibacteria bacterium]
MKVKFKKLNPDVRLPEYSHSGDAGANVFSLEDKVIKAGQRETFHLGFATEFPATHVGLIWDRGGLAALQGLTCLAGVADANYRGEWVLVLLNTSDQDYQVKKGDKIAQILFQPIEVVEFEVVDQLSETSRGEGKFGSTGR